MISSLTRMLLLFNIIILVSSCTSKDAEYTFDKKPVSSIESKDGNVIIHFRDNITQSFSAAQVEKLLKEKKIEENVYQLFAQKIKEASLWKQQQKLADKEKYPYTVNGRDIHFVEYKNNNFIIHMADKTNQTFSQHEIDCMFVNKIITIETFTLCMQKQQEEEILHKKDSSVFNFNYREISCSEFN